MPSRHNLAEAEAKAEAELAGYGPIPNRHDSSDSEDYSEEAIRRVRTAVPKNNKDCIVMRGPQDSSTKRIAEMEREVQFQTPESVNTIIDPVAKASWGPDVATGDASQVFEIVDEALQHLQMTLQDTTYLMAQNQDQAGQTHQQTPQQTAIFTSDDTPGVYSLTSTPRIRPPPPTPPEQAHLSQSLSMPTLPVFHAISEPALVSSYQTQRSLNPVLFDAKTREIKVALIAAKVERGGRSCLEEGDYTVEFASREDAEKAERYVRRRGISDLPLLPPAENEQVVKGSTKHSQTTADTHKQERQCQISGSMRHQHSRTTTQDNKGKKTIIKTWVEITQELFVPSQTKTEPAKNPEPSGIVTRDVSEVIKDNKTTV